MHQAAHIPVLLQEVVAALDLPRAQTVIDATYGRGGHTGAILEQLRATAQLIIIDRDPEAIEHARKLYGDNRRVEIVHAPFSALSKILSERGLMGRVDAILFDFGVSSPQLDDPDRGFSFSHDGPLDMRMDPKRGIPAVDWIEGVSEQDLVKILKDYGEERYARRIARKIKEFSARKEITTTAELAQLVSESVPTREKGKHPATRTFQAIRIALNQELEEIEAVLPQALDALTPGGRLVVISFHSLEDRLVKRFFREQSRGDPFPHDLPVTADKLQPRLELAGKPVRPGDDEISLNPRSRSAIMRVARKLA